GSLTVTGTHTYGDEGAFTAAVTLNDPLGTKTTVVMPALGTTATVTEVFTDANPASVAADLKARIDWGDGTPANPDTTPGAVHGNNGTFTVVGKHAYMNAGPFTVSVTLNSSKVLTLAIPVNEGDTLTGIATGFVMTQGVLGTLTTIAEFTDTG